ncbi:DUF742 domain-containing protein, partial [Streptomyces sp. NPDC059802]|uniref:DUF742 domain-containing protein n=1 Tax=Streptomyces sp. NPDC059802 TaxID=3346952 RepID=UPI00366A3E50
MTTPGEEQAVSSGFVRSYVITGGRGLPDAEGLSLVTLVTIAPDRQPPPNPSPEVRAIWELCSGGYLSGGRAGGPRPPLGPRPPHTPRATPPHTPPGGPLTVAELTLWADGPHDWRGVVRQFADTLHD